MWALSSGNGRASPGNCRINLALPSSPHDGDDIAAGRFPLIAEDHVGRRIELDAVARGKFMPPLALHDDETVLQHPDHLMDQVIGAGGKADFLPRRQFDLDQFQPLSAGDIDRLNTQRDSSHPADTTRGFVWTDDSFQVPEWWGQKDDEPGRHSPERQSRLD